MRVVFSRNGDGRVSVIYPVETAINPQTGKVFTIEEIAKKDVPTGLKYKIVENSDIPTDDSFRDAWRVDLADLTDGVGE
tara:strand:- start:1120 stop:1356 length:237 start_codon:yes stop_codon:yes gene_type:complete